MGFFQSTRDCLGILAGGRPGDQLLNAGDVDAVAEADPRQELGVAQLVLLGLGATDGLAQEAEACGWRFINGLCSRMRSVSTIQ